MPRPWVFCHLAIMAGLVGFGDIAAAAVSIAKVLCFLFVALFVVRLLSWRAE